MKQKPFKSSFSDDIRRSWGYSDAKDDIKYKRPIRYLPTSFTQDRPLPYWDKAYCDGYKNGLTI